MINSIIVLIFGACMGSFISMASHRLPKEEDLFFKRSYCPKCKKSIKVKSLVPIFSWLIQKGKCSECKNPIPKRYILIESITSLLFLINYLQFGFTVNGIILYLLLVCLMIMIVTDLEHYIIPDSIQIIMAILGFVYVIVNNIDIAYTIVSSLCYLIFICVLSFVCSKVLKKEALGGADIKFFAVVGIFLGILFLPSFLFMSGLFGTLFGLIWKKITGKEIFPFGPALAVSLYLCLYFPQTKLLLFAGVM